MTGAPDGRRSGHPGMIGRLVLAATVVVLAVTIVVPAAEAAKKARSCTILKPKQMTKVLGDPVSAPSEPGTAGLACSFDIGPGLGEPGGGLVIVSFYTADLAKGVWSATKPTTDAVPGSKARFDPALDTAYVFKKGKLVGVSVTYTSNIPPAEEIQPQMVELVELAGKKL